MIPSEFEYAAPDSLDEALRLLGEGGDEVKLLAGGHSLIPLMKLRFSAPDMLVDLRRIGELRGVSQADGGWRMGALTRYCELQDRAELGAIAAAAASVADQQVRNRGTIGGSLAHADPASDIPTVLLASEGAVVARSREGERRIKAAELFQDYLTTALDEDEVITSVEFPSMEGWGFGYEKFNRRSEDWAMVGVCALVRAEGGTCADVRIGLTHMGATPLRATHAEGALRGQPLDAERIAAAAEQAAEGTDPPGDLNATPDYKRHLARVLTRRALTQAAGLS